MLLSMWSLCSRSFNESSSSICQTWTKDRLECTRSGFLCVVCILLGFHLLQWNSLKRKLVLTVTDGSFSCSTYLYFTPTILPSLYLSVLSPSSLSSSSLPSSTLHIGFLDEISSFTLGVIGKQWHALLPRTVPNPTTSGTCRGLMLLSFLAWRDLKDFITGVSTSVDRSCDSLAFKNQGSPLITTSLFVFLLTTLWVNHVGFSFDNKLLAFQPVG